MSEGAFAALVTCFIAGAVITIAGSLAFYHVNKTNSEAATAQLRVLLNKPEPCRRAEVEP